MSGDHGKMSPRSASVSEGEIHSGDEEKAIQPLTHHDQDSEVNSSPRLHSGVSSRLPPALDGAYDDYNGMSRSSYRGRRPRSPYRGRRSGSPYRGPPRSKRRSPSFSPSPSPTRSPSPPPVRKGGLNDGLRSPDPYEAIKTGNKRHQKDDHYASRNNSDPRRFKVHYENEPSDRAGGYAANSRRDDRNRRDSDERNRQYDYHGHSRRDDRDRDRGYGRKRSPRGYNRDSRDNRASREPERRFSDSNKASLTAPSKDRTQFVPSRDGNTSTLKQAPATSSSDARQVKYAHPTPTLPAFADRQRTRFEEQKPAEEPEAEPVPKLTEEEEIERRRKRREAIKAKHKAQPLLVQALEHNTLSVPTTPQHDSSGAASERASRKPSLTSPSAPSSSLFEAPASMNSPGTPQSPGSPAAIVVANDEDLANTHQANSPGMDDQGPSAADYDPNMDMQEDRPDHKIPAKSVNLQNDSHPSVSAAVPAPAKMDKEFDMFADDDDDDMFAEGDTVAAPGAGPARALDQSLLDNWDYPDGHYRIILGELLDGRYAVQQQIGKGTFATVVRAMDTKTDNEVAVKIACNNETMYKAGTKEMDMLDILNQADPEDKKHIIRMHRHFDHKGHMCLVFENLSADLREVLKKFGRNVGLNLKAIRAYAQQMFLALSHLKKCEVFHADLKPDNILVNHERSRLKICDLGTAAKAQDAEITPYLVSRFYRAPEIILGIPFDYAIDMWSIGCTLFELYTGRILFTGADNNQMLRTIQECRGKFPKRLIQRSTLAGKHFTGGDPDYIFISQERDKITGNTVNRSLNFNKPTPGRDLKTRLTANAKGMSPAEIKELNAFVDLLEKCLQLDPARRISPNDALRHNFIQHNVAPAAGSVKVKPAMAPLRAR